MIRSVNSEHLWCRGEISTRECTRPKKRRVIFMFGSLQDLHSALI
jgi:hypothetical protein